MFPDEVDYRRANNVDHARDLLADNPDAELLAGGHSLLPMMKTGLASPDTLIDISGLDHLTGIDRQDDALWIGSMTTYATIAAAESCWADATVVAEAARAVGDRQVRNRGTIGGNIAHADPASDLPAAVLAADATLIATGVDGDREIAVDEFFQGMYSTALQDDEILTGVEIPRQPQYWGGAYAKNPSPASGYAVVGVAVSLKTDGDRIESARVAANGVMDRAVRLHPTEEALTGQALTSDTLKSAGAVATDDLDQAMMMDDREASPDFRAHLTTVHTQDALDRATNRVDTTPTP